MKIRIHPTFILYLLSIGVLSSWQKCLCTLTALLAHEAGHILVAWMLGERIDRMELTPFGGMMAYAPGKCASKGIKGLCIAAAGPLGNCLILLLLAVVPVQKALGQSVARGAAAANFSMICLNLLPVLPLDGGSAVFSIGYYVFPAAKLIALLTCLGMICGFLLILLAIYGAAKIGTLNCSLLIIGGYLIVCARKSRGTMLAENLYAVVQERQEAPERIKSMRLYRVAKEIRIHELLEPMERAESAVFVFEDENGMQMLDEKEICYLLLKDTSLTIAQGFANLHPNHDKKR